jgi:4a-hydroxytetrahydrobiopterin dehydratase
MKALTQRQVSNRLAKLELWAECGDAIQRTFQFADFVTSMKFVNEIAQAAERVQHHPDILVRWNKVSMTLSTHDASGITEKDFAFAVDADRMAAAHLPPPEAPAAEQAPQV